MYKIYTLFSLLLLPIITYAYTIPADVTIDQLNKYNCVQISNKNIEIAKDKIQQDKKIINNITDQLNIVKFDLYMDKLAMEDRLRDAKAQLDRDIINSMVEINLLDSCIKNTVSEIRSEQEKNKKQADLQKYIDDQTTKVELARKAQNEMLSSYFNLNKNNFPTEVTNSSSGVLSST